MIYYTVKSLKCSCQISKESLISLIYQFSSLFKDAHMKQTFKQTNRWYSTFKRLDLISLKK